MKKNELFKTLGGKDFIIIFSFMFISASVVVWCLMSALTGPFEHMSCPLLSMF